MTLSAERRRNIPTLDGWRAVAICLVIGHHAGTAFYASSNEYFARALTRYGVNGVPIFFALSGLLICKLLLEERALTGSISLCAFYIRRCFRILPPLFGFLLIAYLVGCIVRPIELLSAIFFFRNYVSNSAASVYSEHLWSLSVEEHFYLLWPGLLCCLLGTKRPVVNVSILALGFAMWRSVDLHSHLTAKVSPFLDTAWRTDYRIDALLWGCVAAFLLQGPKARDFLSRRLTPTVFTVVLAFYIACLTLPVPMRGALTPLAVPLLLVGTLTHERWVLSRILDWTPIRWIGRISYSLYLWQQLLFVPRWEPHVLPYLQRWPINLAITVACASVSYYVIEKPFIRAGRILVSRLGSGGRWLAMTEA
jgi:peptidoglycan/LPS O-acetylase OafA/YrhL